MPRFAAARAASVTSSYWPATCASPAGKAPCPGNPEVGVGLVPAGGALEWVPRLVDRSRALEIVLSADDFDADVAERYGWVNRTLDDDELDAFVDTLAQRLASFDRETIGAAKAQVNRFGTPTGAELQSSIDLFFPALASPSEQARRARLRSLAYGVPSDFEMNFGRYLPSLGRATMTQTRRLPARRRAEPLPAIRAAPAGAPRPIRTPALPGQQAASRPSEKPRRHLPSASNSCPATANTAWSAPSANW
ncbi:enoyl-CoA hydratase/isomerase family protein [Paraburkholderia fungorum]|uniref:enoyl-CoA hydratase/isomerase family protein n=1 Tax=Paraburkholderia fungorum TaxID=134537 RepID=UPI0038B7D78D